MEALIPILFFLSQTSVLGMERAGVRKSDSVQHLIPRDDTSVYLVVLHDQDDQDLITRIDEYCKTKAKNQKRNIYWFKVDSNKPFSEQNFNENLSGREAKLTIFTHGSRRILQTHPLSVELGIRNYQSRNFANLIKYFVDQVNFTPKIEMHLVACNAGSFAAIDYMKDFMINLNTRTDISSAVAYRTIVSLNKRGKLSVLTTPLSKYLENLLRTFEREEIQNSELCEYIHFLMKHKQITASQNPWDKNNMKIKFTLSKGGEMSGNIYVNNNNNNNNFQLESEIYIGNDVEILNNLQLDTIKNKLNDLISTSNCNFGNLTRKKTHMASICRLTENEVENDYVIKENTLIIEDNHVKVQLVNRYNPEDIHVVSYPLEEPFYTKQIKETAKHTASMLKASGFQVLEKLKDAMVKFGIFAAGTFFAENVRGAVTLTQSLHGLGSHLLCLQQLSRMSQDVIQKSLQKAASKPGMEDTLTKVSSSVERFGESAAGRVLKNVPIVGLDFQGYFIEEDTKAIQRLNRSDPNQNKYFGLEVTNLVLDVSTTALMVAEVASAVVFPQAVAALQSIITRLSIVRMSIGDFYCDVVSELDRLPQGAGDSYKTAAVTVGLEKGAVEFFTLGILTELNQLDEEVQHNLSTPESYYKITADNGNTSTLDLMGGILSQRGGFVTVQILDNGHVTIQVGGVDDGNGQIKTIEKTFYDPSIQNIVLGVGESSEFLYSQKAAHLWWIIPVKPAKVISGKNKLNSSLFSRYYGNDNRFWAIQQPSKNPDVEFSIRNYHYSIYGHGEDDSFFLGPQNSVLSGGEGNDFYIFPKTGTHAEIDNFSFDMLKDSMLIKAPFGNIDCLRDDTDLLLLYGPQKYKIKIRDWFAHSDTDNCKHMSFMSADGVTFKVVDKGLINNKFHVVCVPELLDKTKSGSSVILRLEGEFESVITVLGSNFSDTITGNKNNNVLNGHHGADLLEGGEGADTYEIFQGEGCDTINNYATDEKMDLIVFQVPFIRIQADLQGEDLLVVDEESISSTCVQLKHWTTSTLYQHVAFLSSDHVMFHISGNESKLAMTALMVDLSRDTYGSTVNLSDTYQHLPYVITVFDSAHNDVLMGNALGNFLSCSGGTDHLEGAGGSDKYVIKSGCKKAYISNFAEDHVSDVLFLEHPFLKITVTYQWPNVVLKVDDTNVEVHIQNWLKGKEFQHLLLQTIDGVISMLPSNSSEPEVITPIEINLSQENCTENKKTFDLSEDPFGKVERFQAKSSSCSYSVIGNSLDNYIDPGIGNAMKYQYLMGGNGSDTYVLGHGYGYENEIDNGAIDMKTDYLFLDVLYKDITVQLNKPNITLLSTSRNDSVRVRLLRYLQGPEHQHLVIKSSDGYLFKVNPLFDPYKSVISIDTSTSTKSCNISCAMGEEFLQVTHIYGASQFSNYITGSKSSSVIKGGNKNDHLEGNEGNDRIEGGAGDDIIIGNGGEDVLLGGEGDDELKGGAGNDLIYGGRGSDKVDGGPGYDTLFFSGDVRTSTGVKVDLISGRGEWADAEGDTYTDVESVSGTNYNDVLIGDDEDNELEGKFGNDTLIPGQGSDLLFGGPGNDLYILDDCSGVKHINNFASDEAQDYILIRNFSFSDACYFLLEGNLVISFSYNDSLLSLIQQNNLVIFLENWNKNDSSYQHVDFVFANDTLVSGFVFTSAPEIRPTLSKLNSTNPILSVREASETSVEIEITKSSWLNYKEYTEDTELKFYLEVSDDLFFTDSVHWEHQTSIHISGLLSGVLYTFQLYVTQCEFPLLVIAETTQRTIPTAPTSVNVTHISHSNAFITWTAPSSNTDPNSRKYTYVVDVKDGDITVTQITTNLTSAEVTGLKPKTVYTFSVLSDIEGMKSQEVTIHKETPNLCPTFSVPEGTRLLDEEMTDNGPVAVLECEEGFQQISNLEILCLEEISSSPCAPKSCTYEGSVFPHEFSVQNECFLYKISSKCLFGNFQPPIPKCCPNPSGVVMIKPYGIHIYVHTIRLPSRYQHSVTFFCPSGYKLSGPSELDCDLRTGQWSEDHLPSCYQVHCPDPPQDPHGTFPALSRHSGPFTEGNTLELECSDMYHPSPKDRITCRDGDWESSSCEPNAHLTETYSQDYKLYGKLEQWMSGTWTRYITSNAEFLARFCCENRGLDFVGISGGLVECSELKLETHGSKYEGKAVASQGNGWENVCIEDITAARSFCEIIFPNQDGNVSLPTTMFFSVYTYKCNFSGCSLQRREQTCTKLVRCRAICDPLTIPNGQNCDRSLEGQNCSISCNRLHRLEGSSSIQCTSNGWSEKPYCVETEDCGYDYERGPHSLSCLTKLWTELGCSVEAPLSPTKDPHHWDFLQSWTVAEVRRRMAEFRRDGEATCNPDYQEEKCFPGRATVLTSEGNRKSMSELRVGDKVLALNADGELVFSEVILWLDRRPSAVERYVLLTTEDFSEPLSMSADHVTFIARSNGTAASVHTMIPVFAKDLQPGHLIHRYDPATGLLVSRRITNVQESMDLGAYAPLTVEGNLIVDGHLVSCYALQCLQYFSHLPFAPYRFLHTMRSFSPLFENLFPVQREEEDEGMHWYAIAWYQVGQWFGYPFGKTCYPRELQLYHYP